MTVAASAGSGALGLLPLVVVLAVVALGIAVAVRVAARSRAPREGEGTTAPDVVTGLMAELRKWQAEAAYWKATAERLQRELDHRDRP